MNGVEPISILRAAERVRLKGAWGEEAWGVVKQQLAVGDSFSVVTAVLIGNHAAYSVTAGVACVLVPSAYYAWTSQKTLVGARIVAQGVLKIMGTGVLMALFLGLGSVQVLWFLFGLVLAHSCYLWVLAKGYQPGSESSSSATHISSQKQNER